MRNSTKIKHMGMAYQIRFDTTNDGLFRIVLADRGIGTFVAAFEDKSFTKVLSRAYIFFYKEVTTPLAHAIEVRYKK